MQSLLEEGTAAEKKGKAAVECEAEDKKAALLRDLLADCVALLCLKGTDKGLGIFLNSFGWVACVLSFMANIYGFLSVTNKWHSPHSSPPPWTFSTK